MFEIDVRDVLEIITGKLSSWELTDSPRISVRGTNGFESKAFKSGSEIIISIISDHILREQLYARMVDCFDSYINFINVRTISFQCGKQKAEITDSFLITDNNFFLGQSLGKIVISLVDLRIIFVPEKKEENYPFLFQKFF